MLRTVPPHSPLAKATRGLIFCRLSRYAVGRFYLPVGFLPPALRWYPLHRLDHILSNSTDFKRPRAGGVAGPVKMAWWSQPEVVCLQMKSTEPSCCNSWSDYCQCRAYVTRHRRDYVGAYLLPRVGSQGILLASKDLSVVMSH